MKKKFLIAVILLFGAGNLRSESSLNYYIDNNDELLNLPASAAMVGADLCFNTGSSSFSSPANLPFDSLNRLELSYANYFQNSFSTSLLSFNGAATKTLAYSVTAGYVYIPDITISDTTNEGVAQITGIRNASSIYFRIGLGKRFDISRSISASVGAALQANRKRQIGYRGYGLGMDAGARIFFQRSGISAAVLVENITSSMIYWGNDYYLWAYPHIRASLGWEKDISYLYGKLRLAYTTPDLLANEGVNYFSDDQMQGDVSLPKPQWKSIYKNPQLLILAARLGLEYIIMNRVEIRCGLTKGKVGLGAGVNLFNQRSSIDFAYVFHELAGTYQLGISYCW
ncbi:MAG TPA: hypothetical protein VHP36_02395 [Chitinispirillaceae bacterium]|nr:hypothetical protein [Chitinispirillaceae bacterium]